MVKIYKKETIRTIIYNYFNNSNVDDQWDLLNMLGTFAIRKSKQKNFDTLMQAFKIQIESEQ